MSASRRCLLFGLLLSLIGPGAALGEDPVIVYTPNPLFTTPFGPAKADIILNFPNFLPCHGGPIALCYYSGPRAKGASQPDLSCKITSDGQFANCRCVEIPVGPYYVDINGILDEDIYNETVAKCGTSGADCRKRNSAPVCAAINDNDFIQGADTISTFSAALNSIDEFQIGQTDCNQAALYAGCMTAPCVQTEETIEICKGCAPAKIDVCACPTFDGRFQIGQDDQQCKIGNGKPGHPIWSAAFNPLEGITRPTGGCLPDFPGDRGCPLLARKPGSNPPEPVIPPAPADINCEEVCTEYSNSVQNGVELGFTCDATLCTAAGRDLDLVKDACSGLQDVPEIVRLESEVGCSCCASQICECEPSQETNQMILLLNEKQLNRKIDPQCVLNGTLCGGL